MICRYFVNWFDPEIGADRDEGFDALDAAQTRFDEIRSAPDGPTVRRPWVEERPTTQSATKAA